MKKMLFNATYQEELRVATVEGQKLINFDIETSSKTQRRGNVYKGVITRVEPSLEACFVDYGTEKQGFLPFKEIDPSYLPESAHQREFSKLTEGTELIIQVEKDERGNKGAALTTYVSLPGRYLVLMPNNSRSGGVSRRIEGDERDELKAVLATLEVQNGMSVIARTAALGRVQKELQWDLNYLIKLWEAIKSAAGSHSGSFLIYQESNLVVRSIRDHFSPDISEILIDMQDVYEQAKQFMSHVMPAFVDRVKFYSDDVPLFSRFQIEHQIESAYGRMVHLPSGGSIAIDHTEALTAIDVNSAKANKGSDIEATAFATNIEAAEEIARQMRLRDLGGLVVVDFIDMESVRNQREVENYFKHQLGLDRARIQMGKLSKFGLLELSRQRLQASLEESTTIACPRCLGVGSIRGTESTAVHVLRIIEEEVVKSANYLTALYAQLPVPVATYLLNEKRDDVAKIENRMKVKIVLVPNIHLDSPNYKLRKISNDNYDTLASFKLVDTPDDTELGYQSTNKKVENKGHKAVVRNITPTRPAPVMRGKLSLHSIFSKVTSLLKKSFRPKMVVEKSRQARLASTNERNFNQNKNTHVKNTHKTRPVGVNKSNTKIQTVRPDTQASTRPYSAQKSVTDGERINNQLSAKTVTNNNQPSNTKDVNEVRQQHRQPRHARTQQDQRQPRQASTAAVSAPPRQLLDNVIANKHVATVQPSAAVKLRNDIQSTTNPVIVPVVEESVVSMVAPVEKIIERENTITHKVDLGSLEMIATNRELAHQQTEITFKYPEVKRHNDIVSINKPILENIEYELVETKQKN